MKFEPLWLRKLLTARHVCFFVLLLSVLLAVVNRWWLQRNTMVNPPSYDTLVYQNQSFSDLELIKTEGGLSYFKRYCRGETFSPHVPPLYISLGTLSYLIAGRDPINAYLVNHFFFFLFSWSVYSLFRYAGAGRVLSLLGMVLVSYTQSLTGFVVRHFMTDYAAAAMYLLASLLLLRTSRLRRMPAAIGYATAAGLSLLIKSSLLLYYLPHLLIILSWLLAAGKHSKRQWGNLGLTLGVGLALTGWFYIPNLGRILGYYLSWAGSHSSVTRSAGKISSTLDVLLYYARNLNRFHFGGVHLRHGSSTLWVWGTLSLVCGLALGWRWHTGAGWRNRRAGLLFVILAGQYLVLTVYPSKVLVVDFSLLPFYFLVPVAYLCHGPMRANGFVWARAVILAVFLPLTFLSVWRATRMLVQPAPLDERLDWKVKETLAAILDDARHAGLSQVVVGSTPMHPFYTSENLLFYVLHGDFPEWKGRFQPAGLGITDKPEDLFSFVENCDYVVTIDGWQGLEHLPNNQAAPQVSQWLAAGRGGFRLFYEKPIPHESVLKVYRCVATKAG